MKIKELNIVLIKLLGLFLIYGNLFRYSIGEIANINESQLRGLGGIVTEVRWYVIIFIIFCYLVFLKKAELISYWMCKKDSFLELNEQDKYLILKIFILTFGIAFIFQELIWYSIGDDIIFILMIPLFFIGILLLVFNSFFTKQMLKLNNNIKDKSESERSFIFLVVSLLFYFILFRNVQIRSATPSKFIFTILINILILFITAFSPRVYQFLTKNANEVSLNRFIYILFFWLLLLYNLQELLFADMFRGYYSINEDHLFRYVTLEIGLPIILLFQNKYADKVKTISVVRFALYVFVYFMITGFIYKLVLGRNISIYEIFIYSIIQFCFLFIIYKLSFIDKFFNKFQLKKDISTNEKTESTSLTFIFSMLIIALISEKVFYDREIFTRWMGLTDFFKICIYEIVLLIEIIILIWATSLKKIEFKKSSDFIKTTILCISILLIIRYQIMVIGYETDRHSSITLSFSYFNLLATILALTLFIFSDYIAKKISLLLPKGFEERLFNV